MFILHHDMTLTCWHGFLVAMFFFVSLRYFTSHSFIPTRELASACKFGTAVNIIQGPVAAHIFQDVDLGCLAVMTLVMEVMVRAEHLSSAGEVLHWATRAASSQSSCFPPPFLCPSSFAICNLTAWKGVELWECRMNHMVCQLLLLDSSKQHECPQLELCGAMRSHCLGFTSSELTHGDSQQRQQQQKSQRRRQRR